MEDCEGEELWMEFVCIGIDDCCLMMLTSLRSSSLIAGFDSDDR